MRIGFDAKRLFHNDTGLGVYSRLLLTGLKERYPEHEYLLFAQSPEKSKYYSVFNHYDIVTSKKPLWRTWGQTRAIKKTKCDIYHGLSHELPLGVRSTSALAVVTIHDVIFRIESGLYNLPDRIIYNNKWKYSCKNADAIVTVSNQTKEDVVRLYDVDEQKIHVIPPPVAAPIVIMNKKDFRQKHSMPDDFFLYVGSLTKRKNVASILRAMHTLPIDSRVPLYIIGSGPELLTLQAKAKSLDLQKIVTFAGYISNEDLAAFYTYARALIYPSLYEGFGLPIVEALLQRTPVITSNISAMPEAAGPGAIFIDPKNTEMLAEAMIQIMDENTASSLANAGHQHAQKFLPKNVCKRQMELYKKIL